MKRWVSFMAALFCGLTFCGCQSYVLNTENFTLCVIPSSYVVKEGESLTVTAGFENSSGHSFLIVYGGNLVDIFDAEIEEEFEFIGSSDAKTTMSKKGKQTAKLILDDLTKGEYKFIPSVSFDYEGESFNLKSEARIISCV